MQEINLFLNDLWVVVSINSILLKRSVLSFFNCFGEWYNVKKLKWKYFVHWIQQYIDVHHFFHVVVSVFEESFFVDPWTIWWHINSLELMLLCSIIVCDIGREPIYLEINCSIILLLNSFMSIPCIGMILFKIAYAFIIAASSKKVKSDMDTFLSLRIVVYIDRIWSNQSTAFMNKL